MDAGDRSALVDGLATAAVAALAVANPLAGAAASVGLPLLRRGIDRHSKAAELRRRIVLTVTAWAKSEHLPDADITAGLTIATYTVNRYGLMESEYRDLDYDPPKGTEEVIDRASRVEPDWAVGSGGEDVAHVVARRAIREVFSAITRSHRVEARLLAAIRKEAGEVQQQFRVLRLAVDDVRQDVGALTRSLIAGAEVGDVIAYLDQRIRDWDATPWFGSKRPSEIERRLTCRTRGEQPRVLEMGEAVELFEHLVILGGPGAGKSWCAHRIAREAALKALDQLLAGVDLGEVAIPLVTTWELWSKAGSGDVRTSLIEASFDPRLGVGDLGDVGVVARLKRTLGRSDKVLVVVDSLDEASDKSGAVGRVTSLEALRGWRTVVTSREGAWDAKQATRDRTESVAVLEPLDWDADIVPFISAWFAEDKARGGALVARIERDRRLKSAARIPLLLSFYCLVAGDRPTGKDFPARPGDLYREVVDRRLKGDWKDGASLEDLLAARAWLTGSAWEAVEHATTPAGLGDWGETFEPKNNPSPEIRSAVDHVAPVQHGRARRFRHRTLLEYCVAGHIATLSVEDAADVLFPHLWWDPDWEVAAPAAIAAHPDRDRLLNELLRRGERSADLPGHVEVRAELDRFLLRVCAETQPSDWSHSCGQQLEEVRLAAVHQNTASFRDTMHWGNRDGRLSAALLERLPDAKGWEVGGLVDGLVGLGPSDVERAAAREAVIARLPDAKGWEVGGLVAGLVGLGPSDEERAATRKAVIARLPDADRWEVRALVVGVRRLSSPEEWAEWLHTA
ncbi:MAG: NACHT domain-containing protein [Propioniciclava sp.]